MLCCVQRLSLRDDQRRGHILLSVIASVAGRLGEFVSRESKFARRWAMGMVFGVQYRSRWCWEINVVRRTITKFTLLRGPFISSIN